jgi:hypothetical protein
MVGKGGLRRHKIPKCPLWAISLSVHIILPIVLASDYVESPMFLWTRFTVKIFYPFLCPCFFKKYKDYG